MPITPPLGVLEPKNFGFPSFSPGGTSMPKMIKIGEIRVLNYFDLPWNEPQEFSINWEQPEVCSLICLEVMLFQSEDGKRWAAKRVKIDSPNHPPEWTATQTTYLSWKVPKMEKKVGLSLDYAISKKWTLINDSAQFFLDSF